MSGVFDLFKESKVFNKKGKKIDLKSHCTGKLVGLYFRYFLILSNLVLFKFFKINLSAHWCPPCRSFTPKLTEFYKNFSTNKNFEIIFISSDNNEESFKEYYKEMPWLSLEFDARKIKVCSKHFSILL
jgi:thiol-disulfide isomerase/thioredoxin